MVCKKLIFLGYKFALWVIPYLYGIIPYFYGVIPYLYGVVVYKYHIDTIFLNYRLIIGSKIF